MTSEVFSPPMLATCGRDYCNVSSHAFHEGFFRSYRMTADENVRQLTNLKAFCHTVAGENDKSLWGLIKYLYYMLRKSYAFIF